MTLSEALTISRTLTFDLNGKTFTLAVSTSATNKGAVELTAAGGESSAFTVVIKNGKIAGKVTGTKTNAVTVNSHAILTFDDVAMDVECMRGIQIYQYTNPAELNIKNSSIKVNNGAYAVSTEASASAGEASKNVIINIENSTLETTGTNQDNTALLANVSSKVTIIDSTLKGNRQGAILRGTGTDTVTIKNSTIEATGNGSGSYADRTTTWSSGNEVGLASLVIGNSSSTDTSYPRATIVTLEDVTLKTAEGYAGKHIWVTQGGTDHKVTASGTVNVEEGVTITHNDSLNSADVSGLTCNGKAIWTT